MIEIRHEVAGAPVTINVVETEDDLDGFRDFIRANPVLLGLDSETTGLDIYSDEFRVRLVQFGNANEAWVVPVELGGRFVADVVMALRGVHSFILHNASFDLQVFEQKLGVPMKRMWQKVHDTKIYAHLVDPRSKEDNEGGIGHSLEALTRHYIDADVADNVKTLVSTLCKPYKATKSTVWKKVDLFDRHYLLYSGMDPILARRLYDKLEPMVPTVSRPLISFEHRLSEVCSTMEQKGFLLDEKYTRDLADKMKYEESVATGAAKKFADDSLNVNSTEQVADVLESFGVKITGRTPSGKRKVDDTLLTRLAGGDNEQLSQFAQAVMDAKRAGKWRKTWLEAFLKGMDSAGRCHASINPLQARTARMSITGIPAQTLPSSDSTIRRCFVADEGHKIVSVDYAAQELRVLAALSKDPTMIQAFLDDADLHLMTAQAAFGPHITKDDKERKWAKVVNFGRVYGGGAKTVAEQTGLDFPTAKRVVDGFDRAYPGVQKLSNKLQLEATAKGSITTPTGRVLPVDPSRAYSALNYLVQSSSRDVTARALLRLHDAGFTQYLRLPIHDEVLASVPERSAQWGASKIAELMAEQMGPVHVRTDAEVGLRSWGSLYGADY